MSRKVNLEKIVSIEDLKSVLIDSAKTIGLFNVKVENKYDKSYELESSAKKVEKYTHTDIIFRGRILGAMKASIYPSFRDENLTDHFYIEFGEPFLGFWASEDKVKKYLEIVAKNLASLKTQNKDEVLLSEKVII